MTYKQLSAIDTSTMAPDALRAHMRELGTAFAQKKLTEKQYDELLNRALGLVEVERDLDAEEAYERRRQGK